MVNEQWLEAKDAPEYSLDAVLKLASAGKVVLGGRKALRHLENMGFSLGDACATLVDLRSFHFDRSLKYDHTPRWHDVYLLPNPDDPSERLYIKFWLPRNCNSIMLCSFHPEGWQ